MLVYHGTRLSSLTLHQETKSRYGFTALFTTTNLTLAKLYANRPGGVYQLDIPPPSKVIDYQGGASYTPAFRNLMYQLAKSYGYGSVHLRDVLDYPSQNDKRVLLSDIIILYQVRLVKTMHLLENLP